MRPTLILGLAAAIAFAGTAQADPSAPPPTVAVSSGTVTATANGATHLNGAFPWAVKGSDGKKIASITFPFPASGPPPTSITSSSGVPNPSTVRGGYCLDTGCYTFTAACTAGTCTVSTP